MEDDTIIEEQYNENTKKTFVQKVVDLKNRIVDFAKNHPKLFIFICFCIVSVIIIVIVLIVYFVKKRGKKERYDPSKDDVASDYVKRYITSLLNPLQETSTPSAPPAATV
jgi:hypothetical protein